MREFFAGRPHRETLVPATVANRPCRKRLEPVCADVAVDAGYSAEVREADGGIGLYEARSDDPDAGWREVVHSHHDSEWGEKCADAADPYSIRRGASRDEVGLFFDAE